MSFPSLPARVASRVARIIGLLSLAVALGGCSAIKLGYSTLPEVAYWWLGGYVELDDAQSQRVREDLRRLHDWHRTEELPHWIALLQRIEKLAPDDLTAVQACAFEPDIRARLHALRERAEPLIVSNALTLAPAQLQRLERKYAQNNRDYRKEWLALPPAERLDKRLKQVLERAETVYGTLTDAQRAAVRMQLERSSWNPERILAERMRRQQDTLAVLRRIAAGIPLQEARSSVHGLLERYLVSPDPAYRDWQQGWLKETCSLVAALHNGTTGAQREHAARRLRTWQRELGELSASR